MKSNMIVKLIAMVLVGVGLIVIINKGREAKEADVTQSQTELQEMEQAPEFADNGLSFDPLSDTDLANLYGVDVDSPEETMRTLTRELQAVREESKRIQDENVALRRETERLLNMENSITSRVDGRVRNAENFVENQERAMQEQRQRSETLINRLENRLKELEGQFSGGGNSQRRPGSATNAAGYDIGAAGIPDGLGYDGSGVGGNQVIWKNPIDAQVDTRSGTVSLPDFTGLPSLSEGEEIREGRQNDAPESIKAYTLPANSTLLGSTSMTALLGRIPVDGQIPDPYPFKIIVGPENLSSNGINIPDVQGITMSGIAKGDWTLSCVSGEIHSMTFTFSDGSISTYPEQKQSDGSLRREPIAWFSDEFGIPCVTGERITNAPSYLASRIGLGAVAAYADAVTANEYTSSVNTEGGVTTSLTGDAVRAAQGAAISGGINEVTDWVEKRQSQSFDAIYVQPGTKVHIHMERQVAIDYPINGNGRRVRHDEFIDYQATTARQLP